MARTTSDDPLAPLQALAFQSQRFAEGVKRLPSPDDRDIAVSAAADRFVSLVQGMAERAETPSDKNGPGDSTIVPRLAPGIDALGDMITAFRADASLGNVSLPDMDDVEIGMNLLATDPETLFRMVHLICNTDLLRGSPERAELTDCLTRVGVPIAEVGLQLPVLIKVLIAIFIALVLFGIPGIGVIAGLIFIALNQMDRRAQDGGNGGKDGGCPGGKCPGDGNDGGDQPKAGRTQHPDVFRQPINGHRSRFY